MPQVSIDINSIKQELEKANSIYDVEEIKTKFFGKKGTLTLELRKLAQLSNEEKKTFGAELNRIKQEVLNLIKKKLQELDSQLLKDQLKAEAIDVTLPPRKKTLGTIHPISYVFEELATIVVSMGFEIKYGPEIETEYYNFTALNIPEHHPARQSHDTFYLECQTAQKDNKKLLRTHTSNGQIRIMEQGNPPFKFVSPGKVYRCDYDATHSPMFHQFEGLYIDNEINMGHLKGCLFELLQNFFNDKKVDIRFRPSFFPFTEPSAEVDISLDGGKTWLEILGCGMVHPNVLKNVNIDPKKYQGFAFGIGVERVAMLKYKIDDIRCCYENDIRWAEQHGFNFFNIPRLIDKMII
ncbi:MAG: phenylalanine--tRNA ligase subunit alpha [Rickettsiales bacterium]|nr:phenylalanine--tRNA ligase subunit alpha [Rickettsiales bacterium]